MPLNENILRTVWSKARIVEGLDSQMFRIDACGALIMWQRYGMVNPFGWEIDHIFPKSLGGKDDIENLRALHYKNNQSKADDYPSYTASMKYNGKKNVEDIRVLVVNDKKRKELKKLYEKA